MISQRLNPHLRQLWRKMLIEQPPLLYRALFPEAIWRIQKTGVKTAYLTFDDGPIPEVTPWILEILAKYNVKGTFFLVGDNVRKYPGLFAQIREQGHSYGNHTMHHIPGFRHSYRRFAEDIREAADIIDSPLFRPPHGIMRWSQARKIKEKYNLVMYDVITRDYNYALRPENILDNVKRYVRNGSIIVFHDSLKSWFNLRNSLPEAIEWLKSEGYELLPIPM